MGEFVDRAAGYIEGVLSGDIPACEFVRQACQRQVDDLVRPDFPFRFDEELAGRACQFLSLLPHVKGKWARTGDLLVLEGWQCFIVTTIFGWVDQFGNRRFKVAYVEVPRKNAKSTLAAGIGLYLLVADGEPGAEVYSAATSRDQARIVWAMAKQMVQKTPGLQRMGVEALAHSIFVERSNSLFKALSRDMGGSQDGYSPHGALVDELHAHKSRDMWDSIETGTGARDQALILAITTAGSNRAGICFEQRGYLVKILNRTEVDEQFFGVVYTIDKNDDWMDESTWIKANPNWGVSVIPDDMRRQGRQAMAVASKQNSFLTKRLSVWVNADTAWMNMRDWENCADVNLTREDFDGERAITGLDLASKKDIAARVDVFVRMQEGKPHYYAFGKFYLPESAVEESPNAQYSGWEHEGRLIATPGNVTDYDWIKTDLTDDADTIHEIAYDPHQATMLVNQLMDDGFSMVEYRPTVLNFSEPMKEFEAAVLDGRFHFDGDPAYTWQISNVVAHVDAKDNIYPRKEQEHLKIDAAVATIMAIGRHMARDEDTEHAYSDRGFREL